MPKLAIIGAGPAGLVLALALLKHHPKIAFEIFERSPSHFDAATFDPNRSYTIDITGHGIKALKYVNATQVFDQNLIHFQGLHIHFLPTSETLGLDGKFPSKGWTGSRGDICRALLKELQERLDKLGCSLDSIVHFNAKVTDINVGAGSFKVVKGEEGEGTVLEFDLVVGADGGGSVVRGALQQQIPDFRVVSTQLSNHSIMLHMDKKDQAQELDPEYLHIFSRPPVMMVAGAINGESGRDDPRWFCQVGVSGPRTFSSAKEAKSLLVQQFPDIIKYCSDDAFDAFSKRPCMPTGKAKSCSSFWAGRCVLIGDAAAPFPPVGQGVNAAMEGACELEKCLAKYLKAEEETREPLQDACEEYTKVWRVETEAMRQIACKLDVDMSSSDQALEFFKQLFHSNSLHNSKDEHMSYSEALEKDRKFAFGIFQ
ncbi:hypothetical protein BDR26DRAFT_915315 [Obelidium mucronatum]|nr:hypothetical protein BDR26DRAFT_915315 [Obelidium mucronatum]